MSFKIVKNDITKMQTEAIVNAANVNLQMGWGVSGAIFRVAGAEKLQKECDSLGKCPVGKAMITSGYELPARYIIHAVGPVWEGGGNNEENLLKSAYTYSLKLALRNDIKSISFPLISSGIYGFPKDKALKIAISAIKEFLLENHMEVYLVIYDGETMELSKKILSEIKNK